MRERRITAAVLVSFLLSGGTRVALAQDEPTVPVVHALMFGDADYLATTRKLLPAGFSLGQLVGHVNASLTDRLTLFGEVSATAQQASYAIEVERSILRYDFSDEFKLSAGRFHTPIGYWNTAFHHGAWLQTTIARPEEIKFGSQLLPTHFVGVFAEGSLATNALGLGYQVGVGNGRGSTISRAGDAGDVNGNRAWTVALSARPVALPGTQIGAAYYHDRVSPVTTPGAGEGTTSAYVAWEPGQAEAIAEYAGIRHSPLAGGTTTMNHAYYAQLAYRLSGVARAWKPYARAERITTDAADVIFAPLLLGYEGFTGGVRYDFAPYAALKSEVRRERLQNAGWSSALAFQATFTVPDLFSTGDRPVTHQ